MRLSAIAVAIVVVMCGEAFAQRTVDGLVTCQNGAPLAGIVVRILDSDLMNSDDAMQKAVTNAAGYYRGVYRTGTWDGSRYLVPMWRPDIYVIAETPGVWLRSHVYPDHRVGSDLRVNLTTTEAVASMGGGFVDGLSTMFSPSFQAYLLYFARIGKPITPASLNPSVSCRYQRYYRAPLHEVRTGVSSLVTGGITDCLTIYFGASRAAVANVAQQGGAFTAADARLFFHELAHAEQCFDAGSRSAYARRWFGELPHGTILAINDRQSLDSKVIHDAMPMEAQAEAKALSVCSATGEC